MPLIKTDILVLLNIEILGASSDYRIIEQQNNVEN